MRCKCTQELGASGSANRYRRPFEKLDVQHQLCVVLDVFGLQHIHRNKEVSYRTCQAREVFIYRALTTRWRADGLNAGTAQSMFSMPRWLCAAIGKDGMVLEPKEYGYRLQEISRDLVATTDKSWFTRRVIFEQVVAQVKAYDIWVGTNLELMQEFGLRVKESRLIHPRAADCGTVLFVVEGTKGGRPRSFQLRTDAQRQALDCAKQVSQGNLKGALIPPGRNLEQACQRAYYVCRKFGITKDQLEVRPHGLRHEFANDRYEEIADTPTAVRGGLNDAPKDLDQMARQTVTNDLGHAKLQITASYTGTGKPMERKHKQAARTINIGSTGSRLLVSALFLLPQQVQMICPSIHHCLPAIQIFRVVVCACDRISFHMRKL